MIEKQEQLRLEELLGWIDEWGIETELLDYFVTEHNFEQRVEFVREWFDGWGDADAIVAHYYL